ncbi:LuxR C-terminal-related transcriptional regulator [Streptomyces sp. NPDC058701]|uniref:helix-turn-helix transcriptional regulator n=1 Tax=Streptomyces sp. NPDC058701 TaxID=3346608 RepID=UPI0036527913
MKELEEGSRVFAVAHGPMGVLITGPRGVGRTRMAQELRRRTLRRSNWRLIEIHPPGSEDVTDVRSRLAALGQETRKRPVLLYIDDAHLLQEDVADAVLMALRYGTVRVILTAATVERQELPRALHELWRADHVHLLDLGPLRPAAARRLAEELSPVPLDRFATTALATLSEGNPLLLRELLRTGIEEQTWHAARSGDRVVPTIRPIVVSHLMPRELPSLDPATRAALEFVVLARQAPLDVLRGLFDGRALLHLEDLKLIRVVTRGIKPHVEVAHPLLGQALRQSIAALRAAHHLRVWLKVVPMAEQSPDLRLHTIEWSIAAGETVPEKWLERAVRTALAAGDLVSAHRVVDLQWASYRSLSAAELRSHVLLSAAEFDDLDEMLAEVERTHAAPLPAFVREVRARADILIGNAKTAATSLEAVTSPRRGLLHGMHAYFAGRMDEAVILCEPYLEDADHATRVEAVVFTMAALCHQARPVQALACYDRYQSAPVPTGTWALHLDSLEELRAAALHDLGRLGEAEELLGAAHAQALTGQSLRQDAQRGLALGFTLYEQGRIAEALRYFSFSSSYQVGWKMWEERARIYTVLASMHLPSDERLPVITDDLADIAPDHLGIYLPVARAWQAWLYGGLEEASSILLRAAEAATAQGAVASAVIAAHELARMGLAREASAYWNLPVEGPFLQARLDYAQAVATHDIKLLGRAARGFAGSGAELYAAESYAEMHRMCMLAGRERAATAAVVQAQDHLSRCSQVDTPALRFLGHTAALTDRERCIADMAARGWSDRDIADHLSISPRTVSNTLYRVYRKLGVTNRHQLVAGG